MPRNKSHKPRVFCIGWHKTGTTTMGLALLELGYSVLGCRLDMAPSLLNGNIEPALEEAGKYDALQDVPWAALYQELDERYPKSKFILTVRDPETWLYSALTHFNNKPIDLHEWLYGEDVMRGNEAIYKNRFQKHYVGVQNYFKNRSRDLLTMDFQKGDGWEKLCSFLDEPVPTKNFPHANKGKHNYTLKDKMINMARKCVPQPIRKVRVDLLEKIGLHKGEDRFNNINENRNWQRQNK